MKKFCRGASPALRLSQTGATISTLRRRSWGACFDLSDYLLTMVAGCYPNVLPRSSMEAKLTQKHTGRISIPGIILLSNHLLIFACSWAQSGHQTRKTVFALLMSAIGGRADLNLAPRFSLFLTHLGQLCFAPRLPKWRAHAFPIVGKHDIETDAYSGLIALVGVHRVL